MSWRPPEFPATFHPGQTLRVPCEDHKTRFLDIKIIAPVQFDSIEDLFEYIAEGERKEVELHVVELPN